MQGMRANGNQGGRAASQCRLNDLEGMSQITGIPLVDLRMWARWAQMRRTMGSLFYGLGILLGLFSLATIPLWDDVTPRLVAVAVALVGALVAATVVHHVEASILDYLPTRKFGDTIRVSPNFVWCPRIR